MGRRVRYSKEARAGLLQAFNYIRREAGSRSPADRYVDTILTKCSDLAELPATMGRPRPEFGADLRSFVVGRHVVFFRYEDPRIFDVVAIVDGHRDLASYFGTTQ